MGNAERGTPPHSHQAGNKSRLNFYLIRRSRAVRDLMFGLCGHLTLVAEKGNLAEFAKKSGDGRTIDLFWVLWRKEG